MLTLALAALDAAAGVYLVRYARRRERRDKDAVLAVGYFLLVCAVALLALTVVLDEDQPLPTVPGTSRV